MGFTSKTEEHCYNHQREKKHWDPRNTWRRSTNADAFGEEDGFKPSSDMLGYYKLLEVEASASIKEIQASFRRQAMLWHPDLHQNASPNDIKEATIKFKKIMEAYQVIRNPEKRKVYDRGKLND